MAELPAIDEATRDFLKAAPRHSGVGAWPEPRYAWMNYPEWVDGSMVLEFDAAIIEAREGWFVLARFDGCDGSITRTGPVGGLATAEAIVSGLRKSQAAAVGRALGALHRALESFDRPDWPEVPQ